MLFVSKSTNDNQWPWQDIFYSFLLLEDQRRLKWCLTGAYQSRKIAFLSQMLPPLLLLPPEGMAGQVLFNVWMEGIVYDCILLGVLMGLRTMELWEIMTSSDVRAIAQYLKKKFFFSKFRIKIECNWSYGSKDYKILKFPNN